MLKEPKNANHLSEGALTSGLKLTLDDQPIKSDKNSVSSSQFTKENEKSASAKVGFNFPLDPKGKVTKIVETLETTAKNSSKSSGNLLRGATRGTLETYKGLEIERKVGNSYVGAKNVLVKGVDSVGGAIQIGYEQSSALIAAQVAIIKEGLDEAISAVKDFRIKKRITDSVYPIQTKVFIHSVTCELRCKYDIKEIIGKGSFSVVRRAIDLQSKVERAVKLIIKNNLDESQTQTIQNEVEILKSLDHPNIVRVTEVVEEVNKLCIVTELCTGGELFDKIVDLKSFDEKTAAKIMYQLLSGLIHIHKKGYIHMDLKPENIMFSDSTSDTIKIIDLGIAQQSSTSKQNKHRFGSVTSK